MNKYSKNNYRFSGDFYRHKDNTLFSNYEMFGREIADKKEFDNLLMEHIPMIIEGIEHGFQRGLKILKDETPLVINWRNTKSSTYAPRIYDELTKRFRESSGWLDSGCFHLTISGFILLCKMITPERRKPSNAKTKAYLNRINQKSNVPGDFPFIYICYEVDSSGMQLIDIIAQYIVNNKIEWVSSLYDLQSNNMFDYSKNQINLNALDENNQKKNNVSIRAKKKNNTKD